MNILDHEKRIVTDPTIRYVALAVILLSAAFTLPALFVSLGLSAEGDAVDYRIPMVKWMIRHHQFPNWPWTLVDDYPSLGEILMAVLGSIKLSFARLVPISAYLGLGVMGGWFAQIFAGQKTHLKSNTIFLLGFAWALGLRPLALQANLYMVDNLASFFILGSLLFLFFQKPSIAGLFAAGAMATRYSMWPMVLILPLLIPFRFKKQDWFPVVFKFSVLAILGAFPFLIRNFLVNQGNPFFPIGDSSFAKVGVDHYGRGKDLISFLLLPWDLLYTNTFVKGFFDYTIGKLFYVQLILVTLCARPKFFWGNKKNLLFFGAFVFLFTVIWFRFGQQMRFLVPVLLILNMAMLAVLIRGERRAVLLLTTLLVIVSAYSIQSENLSVAFNKKSIWFQPGLDKAKSCFDRAGVGSDSIMFVARDGILGFFDADFTYAPEHVFGLAAGQENSAKWIYTLTPREGFEDWPKNEPCILKKRAEKL